jgi:hypothetical protein
MKPAAFAECLLSTMDYIVEIISRTLHVEVIINSKKNTRFQLFPCSYFILCKEEYSRENIMAFGQQYALASKISGKAAAALLGASFRGSEYIKLAKHYFSQL